MILINILLNILMYIVTINKLLLFNNFKTFTVSKISMSLEKHSERIYNKKISYNTDKYIFNKNYPGTAPPGLVDENFPLKDVLELKINNLNVKEFSRDQNCGVIRGSDESILNWLEKKK